MAIPECPKSNSIPSSHEIDPTQALIEVNRQLEIVEENENTIERFFRRDKLLEQLDLLQAEIDLSATPPEHP